MKFILAFFMCTIASFNYANALNETIDTLIAKELPNAIVGIEIKDLTTGETLYTKNADKLLSPASGMKLLTAAAALYHLTPDFRFNTTLSQNNNDYYLSFSGSPALKSSDIATLITQLRQQGVQTIAGNFVLVASPFKPPYYAGGVSLDDLGWYYAAPDGPFVVDENACEFDFTTAKKQGGPVQITANNPCPSLTLINELKTMERSKNNPPCDLTIENRSNNTLGLVGCLAKEEHPKLMKLAIPDPVQMSKLIIKKELEKNGIALKGQIISAKGVEKDTLIAKQESEPLITLIDHMLKESDNLYAGTLTKQIGLSFSKEGSYKQGAKAIKEILAKNTHIDPQKIEISDGIGTRYNLITAQQLVQLLTDIYTNKTLNPLIIQSLPQAGTSGSLKERFIKTNLQHLVYAKTGTMHDISSLSGFLIKENAHPIVFSIIINGINKPIYKVKLLEEQILLAVNQSLKTTS